MAAPGPAPAAPADPAAAVAKYDAITQAGSDKDQAIITKVEAQLANSPMGWLQGLLGETSAKADSEKGEAQDKVDEMKDEVDKNKKDAPPDAGAPPAPGQAAKPSVNTPASAKGAGDKGGAAKKGGDAGKGKQPAKGGGQKPAKGGAPAAPAGDMGDMVSALAAGDGDIGKALDAYAPKSPQTMETIGKIKQMGDVAKGFSGQIDTYVGTAGDGINGAIASAGNWIGEGKNIAAVWANNPYKKAEGFLGTIMKVLSAIKSIAGVVGSICGKIGLILTVVGLLGMIFPPIGAAVSAVARILNIVGLICDVISFALSGVLTGLNGVRLAQLIASGASPEEKAASADLLMSEANDAASGVISLAMQFGPKFMKGMLGKSKGILNGLMKRAKAVLGNLAAKAGGNIKNFVQKVLTKFGVGVKGRIVNGAWQAEKGLIKKTTEAVGNFAKKTGTKIKDTVVNSGVYKKTADVAGKVWKKGGDLVEKIKTSPTGQKVGKAAEYVKKKGTQFKEWTQGKVNQFNNSATAKKLDTFAAKTNKFGDKIDLEMKVEKMGEKVGSIGENWNATKNLNKGTDVLENQTKQYKEQMAKQQAENLGDAREKYLRQQSADKNAEYKTLKDEGAGLKERGEPWKESKKLDGEADQVKDLTVKEAKVTRDAGEKTAKDAQKQAEITEAMEKQAQADRNKNPTEYADKAGKARERRREMEETFKGDVAERKRLTGLGDAATDADKKALEELNSKLKPLDEVSKQDDLYYKTLSGGTERTKKPEGVIETAKTGHDAFKKGRDAYDTWIHAGEDGPIDRSKSWDSAESFDFKDPLKWNKASASANADKRAGEKAKAMGGAPALSMPDEKAEFHDFVVKKQASFSIASSAKQILARIKKTDPAAKQAKTPKAPSGPTAPAGPTNAAPTNTPAPQANAPQANAPAPQANAPAPQANAPAPQGNAPAPQANAPAPQGNAPAPQANAPAPQGNAPAPAPNGPAPAQANAPAPDAGGGGAEPAAPTADPAAAGGGGGGDGGGGEPLPYWPHLIASDGEFTMAMKEFTFMRKVAIEFKKGQISAKQKGVDTLAVYGKYDEYAAKRKADAAAHAQDTTQAGAVTQQNQTAAGEGESQSGKANSEQEKGKGQAGQKAAVDLPEPESRGFWGRIIGRIKRWAKNKAAEIFGWIQEKIANVILKGLCGVSMGDMKAYSGALKNQQARAKGVADTGVETSGKAGEKQDEVKTTAQTETSKAEADIAEADTNITEADTFLSDINNFEQQLKGEMAQAASFIQQITAEVTAARAKDKEEKAKEAEEAAKAAALAKSGGNDDPTQTVDNGGGSTADTDGDGAPDMSVDPAQPVQQTSGDEQESQEEEGEEKDPNEEANVAVVKEAVDYVGGAGDTAVGQLEGKKEDYKNQLKAATTNRDEGQTKEIEPVADEIVKEFQTTLSEVKIQLAQVEGTDDAAVDAIVSIATDLDTAISTAHTALDDAFSKLYDQIKGSSKKTGAKVMDAVNDKAKPVEDFAQDKLDQVEPTAEKAWSKGKDAVGAVANPVGDAAENVGAGAVDLTARAGIGAGWVAGKTLQAAGDAQMQGGEYGVPMMPY